MSDHTGLKLGNYRIVRLLGQGGFAHVYLGEHVYLKTPAAIKVLNMQLANDALESFLKEARTIARLEHPHIIRVLEFGIEEITPFLVMNYAENGTLRQRYPRKSLLPWAKIVSYTKQIADALQYAHGQGVVHRDVKPENMLLRKNKALQLSDFGLAVIAQSMSANAPTIGTRAGTTAYMAPEQIQGRPGRASDQYALGIVVYEWFCGSWPFTGSEREITVQQLYTLPPSMRAKVPAITPAIENVVMKALAKEPQERFATVQEFAYALEDAWKEAQSIGNEGSVSLAPDIASLENSQDMPLLPQEMVSHIASEEPTQKIPAQLQELNSASSSVSLSLPAFADGTILTDPSRISQPSLDPKSISLRELSLQLSSQLQAKGPQIVPQLPLVASWVDTVPFPPHTPPAGFVPGRHFPQAQTIRTPQETVPQQVSSQPPITPLATSMIAHQQRPERRSMIVLLGGLIVIALIMLTGVLLWPRFIQNRQAISSPQHTESPVVIRGTSVSDAVPTPGTNKTGASTPTVPTQAGVVPTVQPGTTPVPTATTQPGITPTATAAPTPQATPTPVPALAITITSAPTSVVGGTIVTVATKANQGGVTIALNGKRRVLGQQTADSQGIAVFQIRVPAAAKVVILTATAIDQNGNQASSSPWTITVT